MLSTPGPSQVTHSSSASTVRVVPGTLFTTNAWKNATDPRCCRTPAWAKWPTPRAGASSDACRTHYLRRMHGRMTRILDAVDAPAEPSGPTLEREHHPKRDGHAIYDKCTEECHRSSMLSTPGPGQVTHSSSGSTVRVVPSTLFTRNARKNATDPRYCRCPGRAK